MTNPQIFRIKLSGLDYVVHFDGRYMKSFKVLRNGHLKELAFRGTCKQELELIVWKQLKA